MLSSPFCPNSPHVGKYIDILTVNIHHFQRCAFMRGEGGNLVSARAYVCVRLGTDDKTNYVPIRK